MRVLIPLLAVLLVTCDYAQSKPDDPICELCETFMNYVDEALKSNQTDQQIKAELEKVCSEIPLIGAYCKSFVDENFDKLVNLVKNMSAEQACSDIGFCKNASLHVLPSVKDSPLCEICQLVVQEVSTLLAENSTDDEIKKELDALCQKIPLVGSLCQQVVDEYLPQIIQDLQKELNPEQVCHQDLKLCNSSRSMLKAVSPKSNVTCAACEFALKEIQSMIGSNATEQEIIAAVEKVCSLLPGTITDECDQLVKQYGPQLIKQLVELDPDEVCSGIGLCTKDILLKGKFSAFGSQ